MKGYGHTKHKPAKKNTGQCFSIELQFICKTSDKSEKNEKRPKIRHRSVMPSALQMIATEKFDLMFNQILLK